VRRNRSFDLGKSRDRLSGGGAVTSLTSLLPAGRAPSRAKTLPPTASPGGIGCIRCNTATHLVLYPYFMQREIQLH
jgi:hypothetical protein